MSEMLSPDPKHDEKINERGSEAYSRSRGEKREHKRKREHKEDASRKKERQKGKDHHRLSSKSSAKQKTKERVGRWKNQSPDSASLKSGSSTSFTHNKRISHRHHHHHRHRSRSDGIDNRPREQIRKRYRADNETLGKDYSRENYEGLHDSTCKLPKVDKSEVQRQESTTKSRHESSVAMDSELKGRHSESRRKDGYNATISRTMEQEKGLGVEKEKGLEVELRQRAWENFMRHQDIPCKMDEHRESPNSASCFRDASDRRAVTDTVIARQNQHTVAEVDGDWTARLSALSDAVSVDATVDEHHWSVASNALLPIQYKSRIEGSTPACHSDSSMEEGEISNDTVQPFNENDAGNENFNPLVEEDVVYEREDIGSSEERDVHASIDASKKEHKLTTSSSLPEGAMAADMQAELSGVILRDVAEHSKSIDLQHELPSKSEQEFKRINTTVEHHELKGLQTAAPIAAEEIVGKVEKACVQKASTATTLINEKSELSREHEEKNSECVSKPELATGRQDGTTSFEQKTMSVMRGGELVQVNYKVYIPKRAAELARRRLHR